MTPPADTPPTRRTYAKLAAAAVAFVIYGSLVPLEFRPRPDAVTQFQTVLFEHKLGSSRSDWAANVLLGVPVGFCVLAVLRVDRPAGRAGLWTAVAVWPCCVAFATAVEFSQLYTKDRQASFSDILAQGLGSLAGILAWLTAGPRFTALCRSAWAGPRVGGTAGKLLVVYVAGLVILQLLPLNLSASPADVVRKFRDGQANAIPFAEFVRPAAPSAPLEWPKFIKLAALYLPAGLLAAGLPGAFRRWSAAGKVLGAGLLLGVGIETLQLLVKDRTASATDAVAGGLGGVIGWAVGRAVASGRPGGNIDVEGGLIFGQAWLMLLVAVFWPPFDFNGSIGRARLGQVNWVPFAQAQEKNPLFSLDEAGEKVCLFAPLGAVVAAVGLVPGGRRRLLGGAAVGAGVSALIEAGQLFLATHWVSPTDVLYGAAGGWLGVVAAHRIRVNAAWAGRLQRRQTQAFPPPDPPTPPRPMAYGLPLPPLPTDDIDPPIHVRLTASDSEETNG